MSSCSGLQIQGICSHYLYLRFERNFANIENKEYSEFFQKSVSYSDVKAVPNCFERASFKKFDINNWSPTTKRGLKGCT